MQKSYSVRSTMSRVNFRYNIYFPVSHSGSRPENRSSHQRRRRRSRRIKLTRSTTVTASLVETPARAPLPTEFRRGSPLPLFCHLQFLFMLRLHFLIDEKLMYSIPNSPAHSLSSSDSSPSSRSNKKEIRFPQLRSVERIRPTSSYSKIL